MPDLIERTHELAEFVGAAATEYGFDPGAVVPVGYSNGANIAASLLLVHPRVSRAAVLFRPMVPFVPASRPRLDGIPVCVAVSLGVVGRPVTEEQLPTEVDIAEVKATQIAG